MRTLDGTWNVVIVGKWNRYILTPEWVSRNIFQDENIEVQFPVNRPDLAPRYRSNQNILFMPAVHRCQFIAQSPYRDETLTHICFLIRRLTEILEHTPVSAMGVNFGFEEDSSNFNFLNLFQLAESDRFSELAYSLNSTEIKRQFVFDGIILNLTVAYSQDNVTFNFNFHYDVTTTTQLVEIAVDDLITTSKDRALYIMENIYNLELEPFEEDL